MQKFKRKPLLQRLADLLNRTESRVWRLLGLTLSQAFALAVCMIFCVLLILSVL